MWSLWWDRRRSPLFRFSDICLDFRTLRYGAVRRERSASGNHSDAADLLKLVDKSLGADLAKILGYKNNAAYGTREISDGERKTCLRVAGQLFERAQRELQATPG